MAFHPGRRLPGLAPLSPFPQAACEIEVRIDELLKGLALQARHQDQLERALAQASAAAACIGGGAQRDAQPSCTPAGT